MQNLLDFNHQELTEFVAKFGHKPFRANQLLRWIYKDGELSFDNMSDIAKDFRETLNSNAHISLPEIKLDHTSHDGTRKWLLNVGESNLIEMVFIPETSRGTLCVSSQVGCALECTFCSTGRQGFNRNLTSSEIIGQLWLANKLIDKKNDNSEQKSVTNVVMMGMGEPLMNFDNVVDAMNLMMEDNAYGLSKRRVTLSTAGVVPALDQLAEVTDVSLAISLHAPNDELRSELVPINRKYSVTEFVQSAKNYIEKMPDNRRKATVEYTLMDQVNDRSVHARELAELLRDLPCKINLIPFNPFPGSDYKRVTNTALNRFRDILQGEGYTVTVRTTRGDDIAAACGQLAGEVNDRTKRQQRYKNKLAAEEVPVKILD